MRNFMILAALSLSLLACSKDDGIPGPDDGDASSFSNLSFEEVLDKKYLRAELVCSLRVQKGNELDLNIGPVDMAILDLKSTASLPQKINLKGSVHGRSVSAEIEIQKLDILSTFLYREECRDCDGGGVREYRMQYTPYAEVSARLAWISDMAGTPTDGGRLSKHIINERILNPVHSFSHRSESPGASVFDYLVCIIQTDARYKYRDHFESKIQR